MKYEKIVAQKQWPTRRPDPQSHSLLCFMLNADCFLLMWKMLMVLNAVREGVNGKKTFSFGHCPNDGGGSTHARIFWPSF